MINGYQCPPEDKRFSAVYKSRMDQITLPDSLRQRVLSAAPERAARRRRQWMQTAGGAAACLALIFAAGSFLPRMGSYELAVEDTASCETVSSAAATAAVTPPYGVESAVSPEDAPAGTAVSGSAAGETADSGSRAEKAAEGGAETAALTEAAPETSEPARTGLPEDGTPDGGTETYAETGPEGALPEEADYTPSTYSAGPEAENGLTPEGTAETGIANPVVEYAAAAEAFSALGWKVRLPEGMEGAAAVIDGTLFQLQSPDGACFRAGETAYWGEDVSGDYNMYDYDVRIEKENLSLRLRGKVSGEASLLSWTANGFSYSYLSPSAMTEEEAVTFVEAISG